MKATHKAITIIGACALGLIGGYIVSNNFVFERNNTPDNVPPHLTIAQDYAKEWNASANYVRATPYGNFLIGTFAQDEKDWDTASDHINLVLKKEKTDDLLKHAMVLAMGAGEHERAIELADQVLKDKPGDLLATLFKVANYFQTENYTLISETIQTLEKDSIAGFIVPVLHIWNNARNGEFDTSQLSSNSFFVYQAMLAGDFAKKPEEALDFAKKYFSLAETDLRDFENIADYFSKLGHRQKAIDMYELLSKEEFANDILRDKLKALKSDTDITDLLETPMIETPKDGVAQVFLGMAKILTRERSLDSGIIFSRLSLFLDPDLNDSKILLAQLLSAQDQIEDSIAIYKDIPKGNDDHILAQRNIANLLVEKEQTDEAIKILEGIYQEYQDFDAMIQIGDIHRHEEDYNAAVKAYNRIFSDLNNEITKDYWHILYARGMSYERLKKFQKSEDDLLAALKFQPEHPFLLNYLGYSWADQGKNLDEAMEMILKAFTLKPDDGYIADSVGWVHYRLKNYDEAIDYLERAVELLPYDATINDHLGDAYWQVNRQTEAKFQWERAVNNAEESEAELKDKIQVKLDYGYLEEDEIAKRLKEQTDK